MMGIMMRSPRAGRLAALFAAVALLGLVLAAATGGLPLS
jgi:hypothetical protein